MKNIFYISIFLLFVNMDCHKNKCAKEYFFDVPCTHSLLSDTISIGDTIWVTSNFGPQLLDSKTGEVCTFNSIDFLSFLIFSDISGTKPRYVNEKFNLINVVGSATLNYYSNDTNYTLGKGGSYSINYEGTSNYNLKLGFIAKERGLYTVSYGFPRLDRRMNVVETECNGDIYILGAMNNKDTAVNNFHLTSYSSNSYYKSISVSEFQKDGKFCFVVE